MENISFEDFKKLDLRVGKVISADPVEGSEKLIKLEFDLGDLGRRQILAGIAQYYKTKDLVDRYFVIVANLEPRKMMGLESQGMVLCADTDDGPICLSPIKNAPVGSKIL